MSNETKNETSTAGTIGGLVLLLFIGWFIYSLFDHGCKYSGCKNDGIGWTNSTSVLGKSTSDGGCSTLPCRPFNRSTGGYCSREHALADMGK